tara:strand:+ start:316 stop:462 length:147 start_codon:yes stop_codon:yes gene_type:complete
MIKTAYFIAKESTDLKHFSENSRKKRDLNSLVRNAAALLKRLTKRKKI